MKNIQVIATTHDCDNEDETVDAKDETKLEGHYKCDIAQSKSTCVECFKERGNISPVSATLSQNVSDQNWEIDDEKYFSEICLNMMENTQDDIDENALMGLDDLFNWSIECDDYIIKPSQERIPNNH